MVYFLKEKSETSSKIKEVLKLVENHCGRQMKIFQCDGGTEFDNSTMKKLMSLNGVKLVVTNPYTPQQNGCAERSNRTITEMARTLLLAKNLPLLWAEAVNTVVYTLNQTGPSRIEGKTPLELFVGKSRHLDKFHVFGTSCYVHVPKDKRKKWDPKGKRGIFVGYSEDIEGFRVCCF
jgi:IS30 family transposase